MRRYLAARSKFKKAATGIPAAGKVTQTFAAKYGAARQVSVRPSALEVNLRLGDLANLAVAGDEERLYHMTNCRHYSADAVNRHKHRGQFRAQREGRRRARISNELSSAACLNEASDDEDRSDEQKANQI